VADVFISYNREDKIRARAIADSLEAEGFSVWWDSNLKAGDSYDEVTEKNLREAAAVVVLWSKRSVASKWVRAEATIGERSSTLVPAMIEDCDRPLRFELIQAANLIQWHGDRNDSSWRIFVQDIRSAVGIAGKQAPSPNDQGPNLNTISTVSQENTPQDNTIENTFWKSIQDGNDLSDFNAYLKRYPAGHFVDLAQNRIAALTKSAQKSTRTPPSAHSTISNPPSNKATPQTVSAPKHTKPSPQTRSATTQRPPTRQDTIQIKKTKKRLPVLLVGIAAALIISSGLFMFLTKNKSAKNNPTTQSTVVANKNQDMNASVSAATPTPQSPSTNPAEKIITPTASSEAIVLSEEISSGPPSEDLPTNPKINTESISASSNLKSKVDTSPQPSNESVLSKEIFKDCDHCPEMKVLPTGTFIMGSPAEENGRYTYEGPQRNVIVPSFAIGIHEVTFDQWSACVNSGGCNVYKPNDSGFGRLSRPVIAISWADAKTYVSWLSEESGRKYRLPSEAEWEYAARGGTNTAYWWGERFDTKRVSSGKTTPVGSFPANKFGLYDMLGNASEWVEDCYINNFTNAPTDGSAVLTGDCNRRVVRGGSWRSKPGDMRTANRSRINSNTRDRSLGFRVVMDLE